jgi:hypothetical protein
VFASKVSRGVAVPPLLPVPPPGPESEGGGGTTFGVPSVGEEEEEEDKSERVPVPFDIAAGGGATRFGPSVAPMPLRLPRAAPSAAATVGGGETTFIASKLPVAVVGVFE